jgi:DNA-binding response OmpR family regulator
MKVEFKKLLLIDDEPAIAETVIAYALRENFEVDYASSGEKGIEMFNERIYDLVILDWMLPGISGPEIIRIIRQKSKVPILMVSARDDEADIVVGLELGADDYITKPFGPREMMARIKSLLRRNGEFTHLVSDDVDYGDLKINFEKQEIFKNGKDVKLTPNELRILSVLYQNLGFVIPRSELMEKALGYHDFTNDRTLDTHIKNIRQKIEDDPQEPKYIQTVRGTGFKMTDLKNDN